ncbi:MAG: TRAP transporter small permease [Desulfobacterales bacterium]|nr:TRAP transporter small permease [Desulfobacterales bacterium]
MDLIKKGIREFDIVVSAAFICVTVLVVILNVILRYFFKGGFFWAEEVATCAFIWSIFVGSAGAYRHKMHIGIDLLTKLFPEKGKQAVTLVIHVLMVAINGYIVYLSVLLMMANKLKRTPVLDIPSVYINSAITVGFGLTTIYAVFFLIQECRYLAGTAVPASTGDH